MLYYAKSTGGFYDSAIHGGAVPADAVEITADEYTALLTGQASGKAIATDLNGNPIAVDPISLMTLGQIQAAQIAKVDASCAIALTAGFTSPSLGAVHTYPSQDTDQLNLQCAVSAAAIASSTWTTPIWCASNDAWSFAPHTAAQVQQVNTDWLGHRVAAQQKYAGLIAKINAATSVEEVQAINW